MRLITSPVHHLMTIKKKIESILVIRNDRIGDLIFASGIFRELRKKYPKARIVAAVSRSNKAIVEKNKNIDKCIVVDFGKDFLRNFKRNISAVKEIRKERFDVGIDLRGDPINAFLMYLTGIKHKIGFDRGVWAKILYNYTQKRDDTQHECFNMMDIVNKGLNIKLKNYLPDIQTDKKDKEEAEDFIKKNKLKKFICISPEANHISRQWKLEGFDEVIKYLKKTHPEYKIILVGVDEEKIGWLDKRNPGIIKIIRGNLRMIYLLFKKSALVLSLDTGTTHLAWPGNSKVITLMMKVSENSLNHTRPLGKNSRCVVGRGKEIMAKEVIKEIERFIK